MHTLLNNCALWFSLFALTIRWSYAQTPVTYDIKTSFGARGDGVTNDQAAFERAATFFNNLYAASATSNQVSVLNIPRGTYLVGKQDKVKNSPYSGHDVLQLIGCRNLTIKGASSGSTVLLIDAKGMRYGTFDDAGNPYNPPLPFTDRNYGAFVGTCINLKDCTDITVQDITLNGDDADIILGGLWGDKGIQLSYDGIFAGNSRNVTIQGVDIHHFGKDGIQCLDAVGGNPSAAVKTRFVVNNTTCLHNGRSGLSLTGSSSTNLETCKFNFNGHIVTPTQTIGTDPAAGIDIEPQDSYVLNATINNCEMIRNFGQGLVSNKAYPIDSNYPNTTRNISINNTTFIGTQGYAMWLTATEFKFNNCTFSGEFVHGPGATTDDEAAVFTNCNFNDSPYVNPETGLSENTFGYYLVEMANAEADRTKFIGCTFTASVMHMFYLNTSYAAPEEQLVIFQNCTFVSQYTQAIPYDKIYGVKFVDNTNFVANTNAARYELHCGDPSTYPSIIKFSGIGTVSYNSNLNYQQYTGNVSFGTGSKDKLTVNISSSNALICGPTNNPTNNVPTRTMTVGAASSINVESGGSLEILANTKLVLNGNIKVASGGYLCISPNVEIVGTGKFILAPGAIISKHPQLYSYLDNSGCTAPPLSVALPFTSNVTSDLDDSYRLDITWTATPYGGTGAYTYAWQLDNGTGAGLQSVSNTGNTFTYTTHFFSSNGVYSGNPICAKVMVTSSAQTATATSCYPVASSVSRNSAAASTHTLFPNPADAYLKIATAGGTEVLPATQVVSSPSQATTEQAQLYDSFGQLKYSGTVTNRQLFLNTSSFPSGVYILRIISGEKATSQQVVIQH